MRKFIISITGEQFEVEVEEVTAERMYSSSKVNTIRNGENKQNGSDTLVRHKTGATTVDSPMPGSILRILVNPGDVVSKGQKLFVLEAMKMENEIGAPASGRVAVVKVNVGDAVTAGQEIIILE
ncbi:MAG: acetyl-CoA carboxylase biotin carboxyl carrier protein subunit [Verrucomicrobia bacterium]|nr:acetyl-CoA carboxylase biotin carboxyl carrier protein subunit [Prolixibacteraceae bacterium]